MKTLPTTFGSDGFNFQQLRREGDIAIFVKQKPPFKFKSYEVVIIQKRNAYTWPNGETTPAHEAMPPRGIGESMAGLFKHSKMPNCAFKT